MKRKLTIIAIYFSIVLFTAALGAVLIGPVFWWNSLPESSLNVWVVDKTVPIPDYREHKGLMWILNHNKIIYSKTGDYFRYDKDYFGFFPVNKGVYDVRNIPNSTENPDLVYLTDTYGVYTDDYLTPNVKGTRSDMIYGGLNNEELRNIKNNIGNGNTLIGEFNIASAPTNLENTKELEKLFGVEWKGWKGRNFKELARDIEVPVWVVDNYEKQQQKKWDFKGEGYVLVSDTDEIAVLELKKHVGKKGLTIIFNEGYKEEFNIKNEIPYQYWFEFIHPKPGRETLANYKLDLTDEGQKIMDKLGLPSVFPAMTRFKNTQYTAYYFAGDYADLQNVNGLWKYHGFEKIKRSISIFQKKTPEYFYWNSYVPVMNKIFNDIKQKGKDEQINKQESKTMKLLAKTEKSGFKVIKDGKWEELFIKGVNIGAALPGKWFTEFPEDEGVYLDWFEKIGEMNANSIRVYTLLPPAFYNALDYYNTTHPETLLWLFQEIWPEENPDGQDYLSKNYVEEYNKEVEYTIDALHGKAKIPERKGRAFGIYTSDVSAYILGYLVGRELEPEEVITTNEKNNGFGYKGTYLSSENGASATEAWLAMNCDYVVRYEKDTYNWQHPVAIVSWPTLDVMEHDSQWNEKGQKSLEYNDKTSIDINKIDTSLKLQAGFFGAYHIYPNYPDFMNNESKYDSYADEEGRFRYGGYLKEFIEKHTRYPALVAEFGLANGMGNAHASPDGYNHGGLTEEQQGKGIVRMMKAIQKEKYAGGLIFEWMDEWAKKTWITEPYMIPYERHVFWHNAMDPEQNYGILAMEPLVPEKSDYSISGNGRIRRVEMKQDASYLYMDITLNKKLEFGAERLYIGLDTYDRQRGEFKFNPNMQNAAPFGLEFLLDINEQYGSKILVHPGYNIAKGKYASYSSNQGIFEEMRQLINGESITKDGVKIDAVYEDGSQLNYGDFIENSFNHWYIEENKVYLRIPWGKINFSDPSELTVLNDERNIQIPLRDELKTLKTDGIMFSATIINTKTSQSVDMLNSKTPYLWEQWTNIQYKERLKKSFSIIKDYFGNLN